MQTIYLAATMTAAFVRALVAQWLENVTAQLAATEQPEARSRFIGLEATMGEQQASEQLKPGETIQYDDEELAWRAVSTRPRYECDALTRAARTRLMLARDVLANVQEQLTTSADWQHANAVQQEYDRAANAVQQQLSLLSVRREEQLITTPPVRVPPFAYAVHASEVKALLDLLSTFNVDPYKRG